MSKTLKIELDALEHLLDPQSTSHYKTPSGLECAHILKELMNRDEDLGFSNWQAHLRASGIKYAWRCGVKGDKDPAKAHSDAIKASKYFTALAASLKDQWVEAKGAPYIVKEDKFREVVGRRFQNWEGRKFEVKSVSSTYDEILKREIPTMADIEYDTTDGHTAFSIEFSNLKSCTPLVETENGERPASQPRVTIEPVNNRS